MGNVALGGGHCYGASIIITPVCCDACLSTKPKTQVLRDDALRRQARRDALYLPLGTCHESPAVDRAAVWRLRCVTVRGGGGRQVCVWLPGGSVVYAGRGMWCSSWGAWAGGVVRGGAGWGRSRAGSHPVLRADLTTHRCCCRGWGGWARRAWHHRHHHAHAARPAAHCMACPGSPIN